MCSDMNTQKQRGEWPERDEINSHGYSDEVEDTTEVNSTNDPERATAETGTVKTETTEVVVVARSDVNTNVREGTTRAVNRPQESFDHNTGIARKATEVSKTESLPGWLIDEAHDDARKSAAGSSTSGIEKVLTDPLVMPGTRREAERDIARVGPEGIPADAKDGPTLLRLEIVGLTVLLLGIALGVGVWFGWIYGAVIAGWAMLSLLLNPVVWATLARAKDRSIAADMERERRTVVKH